MPHRGNNWCTDYSSEGCLEVDFLASARAITNDWYSDLHRQQTNKQREIILWFMVMN